jgi:site-specific recombinase XerD
VPKIKKKKKSVAQPIISAKSSKKGAKPTKRTRRSTPPTKPRNADVRKREYLTPDEVKSLREAAKHASRNGFRDELLITIMYRHGLRVSEATDLKWEQVSLKAGKLHVTRLKNGDPSVHYLEGDEIRALRKLERENPDSPFVFCSERQGPLAPRTVHAIVARAGEDAGIKFPVHPHMLRHAKGYQLASKGIDTRAIQGYLGHKNIQHTVLYTKLDPRRFKGFGRD